MGGFLLIVLLFTLPVAITVSFIISCVRYVQARRKCRLAPDLFPPHEVKNRLNILIVCSIFMALVVLVVVGLNVLFSTAIAFM